MNLELLKNLCGMSAATSRESEVAKIIIRELEKVTDEIEIDTLGNVIAHKKGPGKKLMLTAHMDQPGFMITFVDDKGFLRFSPISGGFKANELLGRRVVLENGLAGVICCEKLAPKQEAAITNLYIDIGAPSRQEAAGYASIGDICVFADETVLDHFKIMSPGLCRIGCFVLLEAIKAASAFENDLFFVFTAQREMQMTGATAAAYTVDPDYCVAFDLAPSYDIPCLETQKLPLKLGAGAAIKVKDSSVLCNPKMIQHLEGLAGEASIPYQFEISEGFASAPSVIHTSRGGVPSGAVSVPVRYLNSGNQLCIASDVESCVKLGARVIEKFRSMQ